MRTFVFVALCISAVIAAPSSSQRIAGGSYTTIDNYPSMAAFSYTHDLVSYQQECGGAILNERAILTAAHCLIGDNILRSRVRLGSSFAYSGGIVYGLSRVIIHPDWGSFIYNADIAVVHVNGFITFTDVIQQGFFAGEGSVIPDNTAVWAAGWGMTGPGAGISEQLKNLQLWTLSEVQCKDIYGIAIDDGNMICTLSGLEGHGQCSGDSGGPLFYGNTVIGILSFTGTCGSATQPSVSIKVSSYIPWIRVNA